jgi:parallel beta-helix repeat protein
LVDIGSENAQGTDVSGFIDTDTTWDIGGSPYIVVDDLYIMFNTILTIEPGVQVKFDGDFHIAVYGTVFANGTEPSRIVFTSNFASPHMGDWNRIQVQDSGHIEMRYCDVAYGGISLYLHQSDGNIFENSNFYENVLAIFLNGSSNNRFIGNSFPDNMYNAIHLDVSADDNLIANNTFTDCGWCVKMWDSNNNNTIINNTFSESGVGIFSQTSNHTIANNTIFDNQKGLMLDVNSYRNRFYHNNFVSNNIQVELWGDKNLWNATYPLGGNYWSDYEGVDFNSTPSQDIPPADGFGDTPYVIDSGNRDEYPLMAPSPGAPPAVAWKIEPPVQMNGGTFYEVSWIVADNQAITHTNVHSSLTDSFDTYSETDVKSGLPGVYTDTITCDSEDVYYYRAHAIIDGQDYFSKVIRVECGSLPEIEHACVENAETGDYVEIGATVTSNNTLNRVYLNYGNSSQSEELTMTSEGNDVWITKIYTPSEPDNVSYYIAAKDIEGNLNKTSNCTIEVTMDTTSPESPKDFTVGFGEGSGEFKLSWKKNDDDTVHYNVYRATSKDGDYQKVGVVEQSSCGGGSCTYFDFDLEEGVTYWYKINAVDEAGNESPFTAAVSSPSGLEWWLILAIVIIVIIITAAAIIIGLKKRKRKKMAMEEPRPTTIPVSSEESQIQPPQS